MVNVKKEGKKHYSAGAIIKKDNKYLLIDRKKFPFGFAGVAGHIDEREKPEKAIAREIKEETNLDVNSILLLEREFIAWNECSRGIKGHEWYLYECECEGNLKFNEKEVKEGKYFSLAEIQNLYKKGKLEKVWGYWFKKLGLIK